jgi:hypothetical protein
MAVNIAMIATTIRSSSRVKEALGRTNFGFWILDFGLKDIMQAFLLLRRSVMKRTAAGYTYFLLFFTFE